MYRILAFICVLFLISMQVSFATNNYEYGPEEYVTVEHGMSPNGRYSITAHGTGDMGYGNFHIFLTNAITGKKIGPLEEISDFLDTGADAYCAKWSSASDKVTIVYRIDRHAPLRTFRYKIAKNRAYLIAGPMDATEQETQYWHDCCSSDHPPEKTFGEPLDRAQ